MNLKKKSIIWTMSDEDFKAVVDENTSVSAIVQALGYSKNSGGMAKVVRNRIKELNINTEHFKLHNTFYTVYPLEEILIENSPYTNIYWLKKRIIKEGLLEYKCEICNNEGEWMGNPLTLQLDHKNGICNDHRLDNLRFLCPNCHAQTETYSGKNAKMNKSSAPI